MKFTFIWDVLYDKNLPCLSHSPQLQRSTTESLAVRTITFIAQHCKNKNTSLSTRVAHGSAVCNLLPWGKPLRNPPTDGLWIIFVKMDIFWKHVIDEISFLLFSQKILTFRYQDILLTPKIWPFCTFWGVCQLPISNSSGDTVSAVVTVPIKRGGPFWTFCPLWEMCHQPNVVPGPSISGFLKSLALDI